MVDQQTVLTREGHEQTLRELNELRNVKRKEVAARIQEAKELGDLSENAEYVEAKNEQSFIEGRIVELENLMKTATIIDSPTDVTTVHVGSTITVRGPSGERTLTIVGSNEANPSKGKISNESPVGKAFMSKRVGDRVTVEAPAGASRYELIAIQ